MKNKYIIILLFALCSILAKGQQLPAFSFYRDNWSVVNPAGISSNLIAFGYDMSINAATRRPMSAIPEAPKTQMASFEYASNSYFDSRKKFSYVAGVHLLDDHTGAFGQTGGLVNLAFRRRLGSSSSLVAGFNFGGVQYQAKLGEILAGTPEVSNISVEELEALNRANTLHFDLGTGLMFYIGDYFSRNNYYIGLSMPQTFNRGPLLLKDNKYTIERVPHIYLTGGMYFFKDKKRGSNNQRFTEITLWSRYLPNSPISIDGNIRYHLPKIFWFGGGIGTSKILRLDIGFDLEDDPMYRVGIGYNYALTELRNIFGQGLEFSFSLTWSR